MKTLPAVLIVHGRGIDELLIIIVPFILFVAVRLYAIRHKPDDDQPGENSGAGTSESGDDSSAGASASGDGSEAGDGDGTGASSI